MVPETDACRGGEHYWRRTSQYIDWVSGQPRQLTARGNSGGPGKELKRATLRLDSGRKVAAFLKEPDQTRIPAGEIFPRVVGPQKQNQIYHPEVRARGLYSTRCRPDARKLG